MDKASQISSKDAISNLIKYSDKHCNLLRKYSLSFFLKYFDTTTIQELEEKMGRGVYRER